MQQYEDEIVEKKVIRGVKVSFKAFIFTKIGCYALYVSTKHHDVNNKKMAMDDLELKNV